MDYCSQTDVEHYLGTALTTNQTATFTDLLPRMTALVDQYCNRSWNITNPLTENFDAYDQNGRPIDTFFVASPPIQSLIAVTVANVPWDMNYVFNYKTHVKFYIKPYVIMMPNPLGYQQVQIQYNSAAAGAVPAPVKEAVVEWIARKLQITQDANKETVRVGAGTVNAEFTRDNVGGFPDYVKFVLDQYRLAPMDHL